MQGALMAFCVLPVVGAIVITALCEFIERRRHH